MLWHNRKVITNEVMHKNFHLLIFNEKSVFFIFVVVAKLPKYLSIFLMIFLRNGNIATLFAHSLGVSLPLLLLIGWPMRGARNLAKLLAII